MATQPSVAETRPFNVVVQAIPRLSRRDIEVVAERLIDWLNEQDGDCDVEEDDPGGQCDEDGINCGAYSYGILSDFSSPGCPIGDGGY